MSEFMGPQLFELYYLCWRIVMFNVLSYYTFVCMSFRFGFRVVMYATISVDFCRRAHALLTLFVLVCV
jgi:hypothetical protein